MGNQPDMPYDRAKAGASAFYAWVALMACEWPAWSRKGLSWRLNCLVTQLTRTMAGPQFPESIVVGIGYRVNNDQ